MTQRDHSSDPQVDPFSVLGLAWTATLVEVREARRRLAFELHPDHGGDVAEMQRVNAAFDACVGHVTGRRPLTAPSPVAAPPAAQGTGGREPGRRRASRMSAPRRRHVEQDAPSFTIDALPPEAYEALLVVASWIGEVLDDDPPYLLECLLEAPFACWCRLDLVPDAGGSTVSLTVATIQAELDGDGAGDDDRDGAGDGTGAPTGRRVSAEVVRDLWVDQLNRLGRPQP